MELTVLNITSHPASVTVWLRTGRTRRRRETQTKRQTDRHS